MTTQPEALRLADLLDCSVVVSDQQAAAELRRLYNLLMDQQGEIYALKFARSMEQKTAVLKQAVAEPVQEPVAWIQPDHLQKARVEPFLCRVEPTQRCSDFVALYTAPPQRKPLTEGKPWVCACGANLYIDADGNPRSKA